MANKRKPANQPILMLHGAPKQLYQIWHDRVAGAVTTCEWSPCGQYLATVTDSGRVDFWRASTGEHLRTTNKTSKCLAWLPDSSGTLLVGQYGDIALYKIDEDVLDFIDKTTKAVPRQLEALGSNRPYYASLNADGRIYTWELIGRKLCAKKVLYVRGNPHSFSISPNGTLACTLTQEGSITLWDIEAEKVIRIWRGPIVAPERCSAWSPNGRVLATGSDTSTISIWSVEAGRLEAIIEGHSGPITSLSFSCDGALMVSKSFDCTVRIWRTDTWEEVTLYDEAVSTDTARTCFSPNGNHIASLGQTEAEIRVFGYSELLQTSGPSGKRAVHYRNAKVVLVGDSAVGKSGLGLVLSGQEFQPTESTHNRNVWVLERMDAEVDGGHIETREILLWDLAGQSGYRLVHQLHLDEVAVAVVVFDSKSDTEPFSGVKYWDRALHHALLLQGDQAIPLTKFLVAARIDRAGPPVSQKRINAFVKQHDFDGYFQTSAKAGLAVDELIQAIKSAIDWQSLPMVSSNALFSRIKMFLVRQKESGTILQRFDELYKEFLLSDTVKHSETLRSQFETCIGRLEARGLIKKLSFGTIILLQPEYLDYYASALVNAARNEPDGLGSIVERDIFASNFFINDEERISSKTQEQILVIATAEDLLRRELALKEYSQEGAYYIFPSQLTRENPELPDPDGKWSTFTFVGAIKNIYTTLCVRLAHSGTFELKDIWQNAAEFKDRNGDKCGLWIRELEEGKAEIILFFSGGTCSSTISVFEEYVRSHLEKRLAGDNISYARFLYCECGASVDEKHKRMRLLKGLDWIRCPVCDSRIELSAPLSGARQQVNAIAIPHMDENADARRDKEVSLLSAAGEIQSMDLVKWAGSPKATLAIAITDIINFSIINREIGNERMSIITDAHFKKSEIIARNNSGMIIKYMGDSVMAIFRNVIDAVEFCHTLSSDTGHDKIRIRAGIHVGLANLSGADVSGSMVNYAARVAAYGKQGGVWLSDVAFTHYSEEKGTSPEGMEADCCENCELKGFGDENRLWRLNSFGNRLSLDL